MAKKTTRKPVKKPVAKARATTENNPPSLPVIDPLQQVLNTKIKFGMNKGRTFRWLIENDMNYLHWLYRQKRAEGEFDDDGKPTILGLQLRRACRAFPLGIDDEAERELKAGQPLELALPEPFNSMDTTELADMAEQVRKFSPPEDVPAATVKLYVIFGEKPEDRARPTAYEFASQLEADAFIKGMGEASGWGDYHLVDGPKYVWDGGEAVSIEGACENARGSFEEGYTSEDVTKLFSLLREILPFHPVVLWEKSYGDTGMPTGSSDFYLLASDQSLYPAPTGLCDFLLDCDSESEFEEMLASLPRDHAIDPPYFRKVDDYNFVMVEQPTKETDGRTKDQGSGRADPPDAAEGARVDHAAGNDGKPETVEELDPERTDSSTTPGVDVPDDPATPGTGKSEQSPALGGVPAGSLVGAERNDDRPAAGAEPAVRGGASGPEASTD